MPRHSGFLTLILLPGDRGHKDRPPPTKRLPRSAALSKLPTKRGFTMRTQACLAVLLLLPTPLLALDVSFAGAKPDAMGGRELKLDASAVPFEPVVIEYPDANTALLRLAEDGESTPQRPVYRFEWLNKDKTSLKLHATTAPAEIERLRKLNDASLATAGGATMENNIGMAYINKGAVVRTCMNNDREVPEALIMYITVTPGQPKESAVVLPESDIATCVQQAKERGAYPELKAPFTARFRIALAR